MDRCFGNKEWMKMFPASNLAFFAKRGSDHHPVMVRLLSSDETYRGSFRFDKRFLDKPNVKEAIAQAWNQDQSVSERLRNCRKALSVWKKRKQLELF